MTTLVTLGPQGSFSDLCAKTHFKDSHRIQYEKSINNIFDHLSKTVDLLIPIENSTDGYVYQTLDGLISKQGYIVKTFNIPIHFSCVGNLQTAKKIYVQFVTQQQCQLFLKNHAHFDVITTSSNSESMTYVNEDAVAIVPMHMVEKTLPHIDHIEDYAYNETRFAWIQMNQGNLAYDKASLIITPHVDRPGLLYDILGQFQKYHINLSAILSRPNKKIEKKYHFYIEIDLSSSSKDALEHILIHMTSMFDVRFLGHY
ncbi:MAG: hypothetical protein O2987_00880 [Firmicutes bacterium]|nr:hypothetical protein [Bacillota bacterium]